MAPHRAVLLTASAAVAASLLLRWVRVSCKVPDAAKIPLHFSGSPPPPAATRRRPPHARRRLHPGFKLNRLLNNNLRLFSGDQRRQLRTLAGGSQAFLLRHWPPPGVRDAAKRLLVARAAAGAPSSELEEARLGACSIAPPGAHCCFGYPCWH